MPVSSSTEHWIKPDAITINLNHFGDPDYLQVSVLAGAVVMAFKQDVIGYNAAHNYRTWPLEAANTYLENSSAYNVYARLTRSEVNPQALVVYDPILRDIEGREITYDKDEETGEEKEILGESDPDYFFVFLGEISTSLSESGFSILREWSVDFRFGTLDTNQFQNEEAGGEWTKMFRLNKVTDLIEVLKTFSNAVFKKLTIKRNDKEKVIIDLKRSIDNDEEVPVNDEVVPSAKYLHTITEERFLRKDKDDTASGNITFKKQIKSEDFIPGLLIGSGWSVYRDANGNTVVEADRMVVRKDMTVNDLVINQETFNKGGIIYVKAGCSITSVEDHEGFYRCYYDNKNGNSYSGFKEGDQARCQRYDQSYENLTKYYWRLVVGVGNDYVDLSKTDCDGVGVPEEGDDIAQLGNRTDKNRQSAIVISPDSGGSVVVWAGIDSFELSDKNMVGMGTNPTTGRAYLYGYGDMFFGDRNLDGNFITYQIKDGETKPTMVISADVQLGAKSTGLSNLSEFKQVQTDIGDIKGQVEREFTIWYGENEPTLENEPAKDWITEDDKNRHEQDLYYSDILGKAWRFVNGEWTPITDERTIAALNKAQEAYDKASDAEQAANDLNYLKIAFSNGDEENVFSGGIVMSKVVGVINEENEVEAMLNGSDFAKDESQGKLILASGIPNVTSSGETDLEKRTKEASTRIYENGSFYAQKGIFGGFLRSSLANVMDSDAIQVEPIYNDRAWKLKETLYVDGTFEEIVLPCGDAYAGARAIVMDTHFYKSRLVTPPTIIRTEDGSRILSGLLYNESTNGYGASAIRIDAGTVEFIYKYVENEYGTLHRYWVVVSQSCGMFKDFNKS